MAALPDLVVPVALVVPVVLEGVAVEAAVVVVLCPAPPMAARGAGPVLLQQPLAAAVEAAVALMVVVRALAIRLGGVADLVRAVALAGTP